MDSACLRPGKPCTEQYACRHAKCCSPHSSPRPVLYSAGETCAHIERLSNWTSSASLVGVAAPAVKLACAFCDDSFASSLAAIASVSGVGLFLPSNVESYSIPLLPLLEYGDLLGSSCFPLSPGQ